MLLARGLCGASRECAIAELDGQECPLQTVCSVSCIRTGLPTTTVTIDVPDDSLSDTAIAVGGQAHRSAVVRQVASPLPPIQPLRSPTPRSLGTPRSHGRLMTNGAAWASHATRSSSQLVVVHWGIFWTLFRSTWSLLFGQSAANSYVK